MTSSKATPARWVNVKRYLWLNSAFMMIVPLHAADLALHTGRHIYWWFGPIFVFGIIPLLDYLIGDDPSNPPVDLVPVLEKERYYRRIVYLATLIEYVSFFV